MANLPPFPHAVAVRLRRYQAALTTSGIAGIGGIYLLGSLALNDFREGHSGIDFVTTLDRTFDQPALETLAQLHRVLSAGAGPALDGFYLETSRLCSVPGSREVAPFSYSGDFHIGQPCFEVNPATFQCLAQSGIALAGPPAASLTIAQDQAALRHFQIDTLRGHWTAWLRHSETALGRMGHDTDIAAAPLASGVLGILRIVCTLETGQIVSKTAAARWALDTYSNWNRSVIEEALAVRWGAAPMYTRARAATILGFLRGIITEKIQANHSFLEGKETKTL
jgi:hypothetical protein